MPFFGTNTGLVITGKVDTERGTHGVAGDTINVASRLQSLASKVEILVGQDTFRQAEGHFVFENLEQTHVKGKAEALEFYKLIASKDKPVTTHRLSGLRAELIGRKVEMADLQEAYDLLSHKPGKTKDEERLLIELLIKWALVFYYRGDTRELVNLLSLHRGWAKGRRNQGRDYYSQAIEIFERHDLNANLKKAREESASLGLASPRAFTRERRHHMLNRTEVVVTNIRMPFWSMVVFMIKWAIAAIPAFIILVILGGIITALLHGLGMMWGIR